MRSAPASRLITSAIAPSGAIEPSVALRNYTQIGWAVGATGSSLVLNLQATMFLFFMTRSLGLSIASATTVLFAAKLYDILINPIVGARSDRTNSRLGRRRPYMVVGALGTGLGIGLFFNMGLLANPTAGGALAALVVLSTSFTLFNVPFLALPGDAMLAYHQRTKLMGYRNILSTMGLFLGLVVTPLIISRASDTSTGYQIVGLAAAAVVTATMLISSFAARDFPNQASIKLEAVERHRIRGILTSPGLRPLLLAKFLGLLATGISQGALLFFVSDVLRGPVSLVALYGSAVIACNLLSVPLWLALSRHFGKRIVIITALIGMALMHSTWLFAGANEPITLYILRAAGLGVAVGGVIVLIYAMLPDVMAFDRLQTGERREGAFAGLYSMTEKIAFAASPVTIGLLLNAPWQALGIGGRHFALYMAISVVPALCFAVAAIAMARYRLDDKLLVGS